MRKSLVFIVVTGLVAACGDSHPPPPPPSPSIQSFAATPGNPIAVGSSASLKAVFSGGTGVVNPGAVSISSGQPIDVTPSDTTTYTLVVTSSAGGSARASATVTVNKIEVTDTNTPDLGSLRGGKPGLVALTDSTVIHFSVDGLEPWDAAAMLEFYASEANSWDLITDRFANIQLGDTSVTLDFDLIECDGTGFPCAEIGPGDHAVLAQLSSRKSSTGVPYTAMSRLIEFPSFSLANGGSVNLSGTMRDVSQGHSISIDFRGSEWGAVVQGGHPDAISQCEQGGGRCFVSILGQPGSAEDGFYSPNADPLVLYVDGPTDLQTGTLHYGTPEGIASGSWGLFFDVRMGNALFPAPLPGSTRLGGSLRSFGIWNGIEWNTTPDHAQAGPLVPPLSMVQSPTIGGENLLADRSGVGLTPTLSWSAPSTGTVSFYRVDLTKLVVSGTSTVSQRGASIITRNTSLTLPPGVLTAGAHVVISIAAVGFTSDRSTALLADSPFKLANERVEAALSSGVLTP